MNTENHPSLLVIECHDQTTQEDPTYLDLSEDRLDEIATAFYILKTSERWERVSSEDVIGILGAPQLTESSYKALEEIVEVVDTHTGTVIVLSTHDECHCTKPEDVVIRLSRAALRLDQLLGERANQDSGTNWSIRGLRMVKENIELDIPTTVHIYTPTELKMMSGGQVNIDVLLEINLEDSGEIDSDDLLTAAMISNNEKTTRPVSARAIQNGIAKARDKINASDSQSELLSMSSFARRVKNALSTASIRRAKIDTDNIMVEQTPSGSGIVRKPFKRRRH